MIQKDGKKLTVLGVIAARGGSRGVPRKNIRPLAGKPLIAYSIEEAKKSKLLDRLLVVSEDGEILTAGKKFGANIFKQPTEFTTDNAAHEPGLINVIKTLREKENYQTDILVMLQATTPFRTAATIDAVIEKLADHPAADSAVSVYKAPHNFNPRWISVIDESGLLHPYEGDVYVPVRQALPEVYWRDGQVYAVYARALIETGSRYGKKGTVPYITKEDQYHVNIDSELDFMLAELLMERGLIKT